MPPAKIILKHPTLDLEVVVTAELAAMLRRYGYTEVNEPADQLPDEKEGKADGHNNARTNDGRNQAT